MDDSTKQRLSALLQRNRAEGYTGDLAQRERAVVTLDGADVRCIWPYLRAGAKNPRIDAATRRSLDETWRRLTAYDTAGPHNINFSNADALATVDYLIEVASTCNDLVPTSACLRSCTCIAKAFAALEDR